MPVEAVTSCVTVIESALNSSFTWTPPKLPLPACNELEKVPDADSTLELKVPDAPDTLVVELKALAVTEPVKTPELPFNWPSTCAVPKLPAVALSEVEKVPVDAVKPCVTATESALN